MESHEKGWRVLFVEDDESFIDALRLVIDPRVEATFARTAAEAMAAGTAFDAACVDLELPDGDGADVVRALIAKNADLPIIVVTVHRSDQRILAAFRAGARGYLLKEHTGQRLVPALEEARDGGAPMSPAVARRVLAVLSAIPNAMPARAEHPTLTGREVDVIRAFASGLSYAQTAASLQMSVNTLRTHVRAAYDKLCVGSRTEAVMCALQLGLLSKD